MKPDLGGCASLRGWRLFPSDNPWNTLVDRAPLDPDSDALIASIGLNQPLHPDWGPRATLGIPYVVVGKETPPVPVRFAYAGESDPGPYPVPPNAPIENGPASKGDRHVLVLDRDAQKLYELFAAHPDGAGGWRAGSGAVFDAQTNRLRPAGWTSADAAGLPILPGLVRYDEVGEQKEIRHALRFTAKRTRRAYVFPARHFASRLSDRQLPPMGMRVRLKSGYDVAGFPPVAQVILRALQRYGMLLADNGGDWFVSGAPDTRWRDDELNTLKRVRGRDFEVVRMDRLTCG